jgi:CBS domain-containing protein
MKLTEVMSRDVVVIHPNATLEAAAARMELLNVGPLPVCDGYRLMGMLTDRDITVRATSMGRDPRTTRVQDVMTTSIVACREDDDVSKAASLMEEKQVRRLVVVNAENHMVGMVSQSDLATGS